MMEEYVWINGIEQYFLHIPNESEDVVLMLHGGPGLANSYLAYEQQSYVDFCNLVYYDQRGAGKTQIRNHTAVEELSLSVLLEDLRQTVLYVREKYDARRVFLLGHSWGTMLGTQFVLTYPDAVQGYIGYGQGVPGAAQDRHYYEFVKTQVEQAGDAAQIAAIRAVDERFPLVPREAYFAQYNAVAALGFDGGYDFMARDVFEIYVNSPTWACEDEAASAEIEARNERLYAEVLFDWDVSGTDYAVPVYYILGRHDEMTASVIAAEYFETITAPEKALYWVEDAGHLLDTDQPAAFFGIVREILTR